MTREVAWRRGDHRHRAVGQLNQHSAREWAVSVVAAVQRYETAVRAIRPVRLASAHQRVNGLPFLLSDTTYCIVISEHERRRTHGMPYRSKGMKWPEMT